MENKTKEELNAEIKQIELRLESLKAVVNEKEVIKDWRDAVEEYHPGFMSRSGKPKPYWKAGYIPSGIRLHHARGIMVTEDSAINDVKDKVVLAFCLIYGGRIDFKYNKLHFRPDGRVSYNETVQLLESLDKKTRIQEERFKKYIS